MKKFVLKELKNTLTVTHIANVHFFEFAENYFTESDSHPFSELIYVESGTISVNSDNYSGLLKKGEMIIHRPDEKHFLKCTKDNNPTVIIIGFVCNTYDLDIFSRHPIKLNDTALETLAKVVKEGRNVFAPPYDVPVYDMKEKQNIIYGSLQMLKILLESLLISLVREYRFSVKDDKPAKTAEISEIINYTEENFLEKITIDELAFLFGTNRSTLCKIFKENTHKTVGEFIADKKVKYACELLSKSNKSISEIAEEMNFESIHSFSNFFKNKVGLYPKEYRNKLNRQL